MKRYHGKKRDLLSSEIIGFSGLDLSILNGLPPLREGYYKVIKHSVGGDAPKDFIRVYEHGESHYSNSSNWPAFIAKVGHKWYPNESITEHFLTRLGQGLGFNIADSRLMMAHGQLRFLSRFFLRRKSGDSLIHGAEIFAGYLEKDSGKNEMDFVTEVEVKDMSRVLFTFQFVESAIISSYPDDGKDILGDFVRLLAFDAIVGNNDRHYFNWGVICDIRGIRRPRLSPIYDTARALFWNITDATLEEKAGLHPNEQQVFLEKYVKNSLPKTGWDGLRNPNHFDVIENLAKRPEYKAVLAKLCELDPVSEAERILAGEEFRIQFSETRQQFMVDCLSLRFEKFREVVKC